MVLFVDTVIREMRTLLIQALETIGFCCESDQPLFVDVSSQKRFEACNYYVDSQIKF